MSSEHDWVKYDSVTWECAKCGYTSSIANPSPKMKVAVYVNAKGIHVPIGRTLTNQSLEWFTCDELVVSQLLNE